MGAEDVRFHILKRYDHAVPLAAFQPILIAAITAMVRVVQHLCLLNNP
jgi:hypothetical protein